MNSGAMAILLIVTFEIWREQRHGFNGMEQSQHRNLGFGKRRFDDALS
jgi:hypothetical protein